MTTLSEGNGLNYRHRYLPICPNQQLAKTIENASEGVTDMIKCEEPIASNDDEQIVVDEDAPVLDIVINNVVCSFSVKCHLNLKQIALRAANVEYKRENGMVTMKIRRPYTTASIWSSGKITCTGATSDADARTAARRFARIIQQLGFRARFANFRVVNVLGTCTMPFAIKIAQFTEKHRRDACYEPELHPGVTYKIKELRATLKIFSTGSVTITAPCIENVRHAVEHIFPLVYEFQKEKAPPKPSSNRKLQHANSRKIPAIVEDQTSEELTVEEDTDSHDSNNSWN